MIRGLRGERLINRQSHAAITKVTQVPARLFGLGQGIGNVVGAERHRVESRPSLDGKPGGFQWLAAKSARSRTRLAISVKPSGPCQMP